LWEEEEEEEEDDGTKGLIIGIIHHLDRHP